MRPRVLGCLLALALLSAGLAAPDAAAQGTAPAAEKPAEAGPADAPLDAQTAAQRLGFEVVRSAPLVINSAELEVKPEAGGRRRVIFKGKVTADQQDMHLAADWLEAVYPKQGGGEPERVTARGHVRIRQATNTALCQEAVFDNVACTATCSGTSQRASLHRGEDVIEADEIFFDLCKGLVKARGGASVRVRGETAAE